jgi:hypothetical protein
MVRRASGVQAVEVYNLETCGLERTLYPVELDETGSRLLDYRADGQVVLVDFQRFDARSGEQLAFEDQYTNPFEEYRFSDDGQRMYTFRAGELRVWELSTGQLVQRAPIQITGDVLARSPDGTHYLTQTFSDGGITIEHVNLLGGERRQMFIPPTSAGSLVQVIPSPGWRRMLALYQPNLPADPDSGSSYEVAVYDFDQGQILYVAGADMPPGAYSFDWVDDDRLTIAGGNYPVVDRQYGLDYHATGLPACLVAAFPESYTAWLPIWEGLTLRLSSNQMAALTNRLCESLPAQAADFIPELTPTPRFQYNSLNTPVPYAIPGVPVCLTRQFSNQAVDYAALWRAITGGLDTEQVAVMEQMICEGLINSPFQVAPTPTIDPNLNVPPTPTAAEGGPQTTDFTQTGDTLYYTIDVRNGDRFAATYPPELVRRARPNPDLLFNFYTDQFNEAPLNPVISLDGTRYAVTDRNGFVTIYRLTRTYDQLVQDERYADATRQAQAPRSIGLAPTATQAYDFIGAVRPTLTPTITPTAPPLAQATPAALPGLPAPAAALLA